MGAASRGQRKGGVVEEASPWAGATLKGDLYTDDAMDLHAEVRSAMLGASSHLDAVFGGLQDKDHAETCTPRICPPWWVPRLRKMPYSVVCQEKGTASPGRGKSE